MPSQRPVLLVYGRCTQVSIPFLRTQRKAASGSPPLHPHAKPSSLRLLRGEPALMHESRSWGESETAGLAAAIAYALSTAAMVAAGQRCARRQLAVKFDESSRDSSIKSQGASLLTKRPARTAVHLVFDTRDLACRGPVQRRRRGKG